MNSIKIRPLLLSIFSLSLVISGCTLPPANIGSNSTPAPSRGLTFETIKNSEHQLFVAVLNTAENQLEVVQNMDENNPLNIQEIHELNKSVLSFNGGFFSEDFKPSGLLISQGKELAPLVKADLLDGIFTIDENNKPKLYKYEEFKKAYPKLKLNFAIQNGPVLIDNQGKPAISNKSIKKANRTALGISKDGQLVVIIDRESILDTNKSPTLYQFADLIMNSAELKDLGIHSVLNLDGGPSTGLAYDDQYYSELDKVQNVIIIKPLHSA